MRNEVRKDIPALVQDAHNVDHLITHTIEHKKRKALESPDSKRCVRQKVCVAAGSNPGMRCQEIQDAQQLFRKSLAEAWRGIVIPVLRSVSVTARCRT